ncbi:MAG: iron-sulfur cluster repair di-iron protein [Bacteroidetes bacterium]|nr:iron-sulfur cluster repair di-iron protein [Bacteroidota bacterium]
MENITTQTLASIVSNSSSSVPVFEKYSLDFCCNGKRTLEEACNAKGLPVNEIAAELKLQMQPRTLNQLPFEEMSAEQMISYILIHHHFYVKQSMPQIIFHVEKVANKHGDRFPYMVEVLQLFREIQEEMTSHMQKEEVILFPRIKQLESLFLEGQLNETARNSVAGPISVMMAEHDHAGSILYKIRELTNNYTAPEGACTTFKVSLTELKEFEEDLHKHVHLENNHLFIKAMNMMNVTEPV